ncbi:Protein of unknown function [Pyronema omphalodes CBS 100304]|uniref:Uncharacterized protein n=1 Tax=Pyronema omphalodes (strain CBS 100304) TaxID=1076935 RepID=U4LKW1_PYROM|nr:Protein of unknown function [Pyronema omphalodes CBS 100304]
MWYPCKMLTMYVISKMYDDFSESRITVHEWHDSRKHSGLRNKNFKTKNLSYSHHPKQSIPSSRVSSIKSLNRKLSFAFHE